MAKDQRLYAKLTLDFADHEKILPLTDAAFRCLIEATLWSRKRMSDGFLATRLAVAKWSPEVLEELATNDPTNPSLVAVENGWLIRDFAEHQDTKADIEARRERNKLNGQKGGLAKGKRVGKRPASKPVSENVAETETETETQKEQQETGATELRASVSATPRFEEFWSAYPRRRDRRKAEKAFTNAVKRADADAIIDGAHRYATDPNRLEQFTKYAEGWLNGDGWLDEPLPLRNGNHTPGPTAFQRKTATNAAVFDALADDQPPELMA